MIFMMVIIIIDLAAVCRRRRPDLGRSNLNTAHICAHRHHNYGPKTAHHHRHT
jgi:hypothetical protein